MIRWIAHDFLLPFHSNYGPILYRFPHIARYWSKIAKFIYFTCIQHPRNFWNFANMFSTERIIWLPCMLQKIRWYAYVKSFRYNTGTWQTDRQAELLYQYREIKTIILLLAGTSKVIVFFPVELRLFCILLISTSFRFTTRGQSNLTKSASRGAHSPVRGHPRGSKVVPLNSWGRGSY